MAFVLVPAGSRRRVAIWVAVALSLAYAGSRVILGADYVLDAVYAVALGFAAPLAAFAAFVPDDVFPVRYTRGGTAAHLDLGGDRGHAIVAAMADQLGLTVTEAKAFGLEGSGGSSPLRMQVEGLDGHLFAKIYSTSHLRADRWYRIGRTLLYGQLEDEVPFASVRRLVAYEDYALRLLDDAGIRVAKTYGVLELTPNREYMLVTEFFEGSKTLGESEIDDAVIDEGLQLVRTFWDEGLAHRDLKPANLLVKDGHLQLVDVSGLEVRPTPWRQAVDLANMMLTLALQADPERVYARATRWFTPDEIAEAFAADVGLAIPTQVQQRLKEDPRPLLARFRELSPALPPISIQRWSVRRVGLLAGAVLGTLLLATMVVDSILAGLR
jgi:tRNA A-37 threonylcarbamoyl transferase component Bud32